MAQPKLATDFSTIWRIIRTYGQRKKGPGANRAGSKSHSIKNRIHTRFFNRSAFSTAGRPIG